jgi:hypothetical protein
MNNKIFLYWLPLWYGWGIHVDPQKIISVDTNRYNFYLTDVFIEGTSEPYTTRLSEQVLLHDINKSYWDFLNDTRTGNIA